MNLLTLKRLAVYLLAFFVILGVTLALTSFWKQWDRDIYKMLYMDNSSAGDKLSGKIVVINIEKPDLPSKDASLKIFRERISSFLKTVDKISEQNNQDPRAIVLDISFSKDTIGLDNLTATLRNLKAHRIDVYAVYNLKEYYENETLGFQANDVEQATDLYDSIFVGGRLHAGFVLDEGLITYPSLLYLNGAFMDTIAIESIVTRVAVDNVDAKIPVKFQQFVAPLGPAESIKSQTFSFVEAGTKGGKGKFIGSDINAPLLDIKDKFLLVGDLKNDFLQEFETPRTYLMAWALNERMVAVKIAKQPLDSIVILLGQTLFFSFFIVVVLALLFKYVKSLQTKPKTLAGLSFLIGIVFFAIYGALVYSFDRIIPIGVTLVGMTTACLLAWRFDYKFLVTGVAEGSQKYDIFLSYSHGNSDWVKKNVLSPLREFRKPNGDKLSIFFDEKSIGIGEAFTAKYMWGIVDSKYFIPIISEEYYKKDHCRNEMDLAYKRYVEKLLKIFPIAFSSAAVPEIYTHINFADITVDPNFMEKIKAELET